MANSDIDSPQRVALASLQAQRVALVAAIEMHIRRSEEIAVQVVLLDEEIDAALAGDKR